MRILCCRVHFIGAFEEWSIQRRRIRVVLIRIYWAWWHSLGSINYSQGNLLRYDFLQFLLLKKWRRFLPFWALFKNTKFLAQKTLQYDLLIAKISSDDKLEGRDSSFHIFRQDIVWYFSWNLVDFWKTIYFSGWYKIPGRSGRFWVKKWPRRTTWDSRIFCPCCYFGLCGIFRFRSWAFLKRNNFRLFNFFYFHNEQKFAWTAYFKVAAIMAKKCFFWTQNYRLIINYLY